MYATAIGGIGGSGTRVVAKLLSMLGYYLGDDLNESLDNLWFTLIFKRRSILTESEPGFRNLVELFLNRMQGTSKWTKEERSTIFLLAEQSRMQHSRVWLLERAISFVSGNYSRQHGQPWCWKEPNTHIVIDRILPFAQTLRYIHVIRDPFYMAHTSNQNQLRNWGPIFLDRDIALDPKTALSYWCISHKRIVQLLRSWPGRSLIVNIDEIWPDPKEFCKKIAEFLDIHSLDKVVEEFKSTLQEPKLKKKPDKTALSQFTIDDLTYLESLGYLL